MEASNLSEKEFRAMVICFNNMCKSLEDIKKNQVEKNDISRMKNIMENFNNRREAEDHISELEEREEIHPSRAATKKT